MLNSITLMGRLTKDPELRYTKTDTPVASFTLAVDRDFGDGADFIDCVAWRKTGEFAQKYFSKGSLAVVTGRLQIRDWTDKDGKKRYAPEVVVDHIYFGGDKKKTETQSAPSGAFVDLDDEEGIPF